MTPINATPFFRSALLAHECPFNPIPEDAEHDNEFTDGPVKLWSAAKDGLPAQAFRVYPESLSRVGYVLPPSLSNPSPYFHQLFQAGRFTLAFRDATWVTVSMLLHLVHHGRLEFPAPDDGDDGDDSDWDDSDGSDSFSKAAKAYGEVWNLRQRHPYSQWQCLENLLSLLRALNSQPYYDKVLALMMETDGISARAATVTALRAGELTVCQEFAGRADPFAILAPLDTAAIPPRRRLAWAMSKFKYDGARGTRAQRLEDELARQQ
jgi:hypothetical protein